MFWIIYINIFSVRFSAAECHGATKQGIDHSSSQAVDAAALGAAGSKSWLKGAVPALCPLLAGFSGFCALTSVSVADWGH